MPESAAGECSRDDAAVTDRSRGRLVGPALGRVVDAAGQRPQQRVDRGGQLGGQSVPVVVVAQMRGLVRQHRTPLVSRQRREQRARGDDAPAQSGQGEDLDVGTVDDNEVAGFTAQLAAQPAGRQGGPHPANHGTYNEEQRARTP